MKNRGSKIAAIAKPIARTIDRVAGTNIENCQGCDQMERDLNAGVSIPRALYNRARSRKGATGKKWINQNPKAD